MTTCCISALAGVLSAWLAFADPFAFLAPQVVLTAADRRHLAEGETVSRTLRVPEGQVASFSIARVDAAPEALRDAVRQIEDLSRSSLVLGIKRFSAPPRLDDLDELRLGPRDLAAAASCQPGACSFKLTAAEIAVLRAADREANRDDALQRAFRNVVLARVNTYLSGGLLGLPPIANRPKAVCLDEAFGQIVAASPALSHAPCTSTWLRDFPYDNQRVESFLYWSQEDYGTGKPVVVVTHVGIFPPAAPGDPTIVLGKQVLATRYMTGGLSLMAITTDAATSTNYLVYLNRTGVDVLGGLLGPLKRAAIEARLRRALPDILQRLRARLERSSSTR